MTALLAVSQRWRCFNRTYGFSMLDDFWTQRLGATSPIAHCFRDVFRDRWVRFHSLPDSKRYAESESEWETLLERHNTIIAELTNDGSQLDLLTTNGSASATPGSPDVEVCELGLLAEHWRTVAMHEIESNSDPYYWHIFRSPITWRPNALDKVIRLVANDRIWNVMVLDPVDSWLLHPYDGGMDVILGSTGERDKLSNSFASWRSSRSDGL